MEELYTYGLKQGIIILINLLTIIAIGWMTSTLAYLLVFVVSYIPLRSYAGGYHAKTPIRCYIYSSILMLGIAQLGKHIRISEGSSFYILYLLSIVAIVVLAPSEAKNKPLDLNESQVFRRRTRIILSVEVVCIILFRNLGWTSVTNYVLIAVITVAAMVTVGELKNYFLCE